MKTRLTSWHHTAGRAVRLATATIFIVTGCESSSPLAGPPQPGAPQLGTLEVAIQVTGTRADPDGYAVAVLVESQVLPAQRASSTGGTLLFGELPPGTHSVRLDELAPNCSVAGGNPLSFTVSPGKTTRIGFAVACPGPGAVFVKTVTTGSDPNPDGYSVIFGTSSVREYQLGTNDSLLISEEDLPAKALIVRLEGVPAHCLMLSVNPSAVSLRGDVTARMEFSVTCFERSSRIAFGRDGEVFLANVDGSGVVNVSDHPALDGAPALSPDRSRVVFTSDRDDPAGELYVVSANGTGLRRITSAPGGDQVGPQAWSPDGSRIAFTSTRDDPDGEIYVMNADGSGVIRLTHSEGYDGEPAWSPDGSSIAFCSGRGGGFALDVYRMNAIDGSGVVRMVRDGCDPSWSPDGTRLAYTTGTELGMSIPDLAVIGVDGTGFIRLHRFGMSFTEVTVKPSWSPDGSWIAVGTGFLEGPAPAPIIVLVHFDGVGFDVERPYLTGRDPSWR